MDGGDSKPFITWNCIWPPIIMKMLHIILRVLAVRLMGGSKSNQHLDILGLAYIRCLDPSNIHLLH